MILRLIKQEKYSFFEMWKYLLMGELPFLGRIFT